MRHREVNPEGYERSAPINFAQGLKGLVDRLIALGKPFDYMVYPNRDHGLREGDGTLVHVRMHILRYLLEKLPSGPK